MGVSKDVLALALENGGYVTRAQLRTIGWTDSAVDRLLRGGQVVPVAAGVLRLFQSDDQTDLVRGALLTLPDAIVSHQSAAHFLRFPDPPRHVPTVTVASRTTHRFPGVTVRRADDLQPSHLVRVDGITCTGGARTLFDLAGILKFRHFSAIAESAIGAGRVKVDALETVALQLSRPGKRGSKAVRDFLERGARPGSALERRGRCILKHALLPPPIPEYSIPWDPRRRFDDAYPDHEFAIEWDSRRWHRREEEMQDDRDRDREAILHGWVVIRFTWADVTTRPENVASTVSRLLDDRRRSP